jgi:hypothetical protein
MNRPLIYFGTACFVAALLLHVNMVAHAQNETNQTMTCVKGYYQTQTQYGCCIDGYKAPNFFCYLPQLLTVKNCEIARNGIDKLGTGLGANQTKIFEIKIADKWYNDICGQMK